MTSNRDDLIMIKSSVDKSNHIEIEKPRHNAISNLKSRNTIA